MEPTHADSRDATQGTFPPWADFCSETGQAAGWHHRAFRIHLPLQRQKSYLWRAADIWISYQKWASAVGYEGKEKECASQGGTELRFFALLLILINGKEVQDDLVVFFSFRYTSEPKKNNKKTQVRTSRNGLLRFY